MGNPQLEVLYAVKMKVAYEQFELLEIQWETIAG